MQAAPAAAGSNPYGLVPALQQGGIIAISVFTILVLMSIFSFYILFTKLMQQQKIISQGRKVRASFWNSPNLRDAATKLEAKSAYRAIVDDASVMRSAPAFVFCAGGRIHIEIVCQRTGPQRRADVHVPGECRRTAIAADLCRRYGVALIVSAEPAVLFGNGDAEQAGAMQVPVILGRECGVAIIGRRAAREHILAKLARGRDDHGLFVV